MIFYMIRHKASGEFMPQGKRNRGYSHWNPSNQTEPFYGELKGVPRLIDTEKRAKRIIAMWSANPNAQSFMSSNWMMNDELEYRTKPDGRTKDDLEVVEVRIFPRRAIE